MKAKSISARINTARCARRATLSLVVLLLACACEPAAPIETPTPDPHAGDSASPVPSLVVLEQSCRNEDLSYAIEYPADWGANDDGELACTLFGPGELTSCETAGVEVILSDEPPPQVASRIIADEELLASGLAARRIEEVGAGQGGLPDGDPRLRYEIRVGPRYLTAATCAGAEDYEINRTILDSMVQSIEILGATQL